MTASKTQLLPWERDKRMATAKRELVAEIEAILDDHDINVYAVGVDTDGGKASDDCKATFRITLPEDTTRAILADESEG